MDIRFENKGGCVQLPSIEYIVGDTNHVRPDGGQQLLSINIENGQNKDENAKSKNPDHQQGDDWDYTCDVVDIGSVISIDNRPNLIKNSIKSEKVVNSQHQRDRSSVGSYSLQKNIQGFKVGSAEGVGLDGSSPASNISFGQSNGYKKLSKDSTKMRKGSVTLLNILNPSHENDQKSEGMAENNKKIEESGKKNKPKYRCSICGLGFARNTSLKSHLLIHSVLKPFVCNVCNMQFRRQQDLKRHSKLHTGEKPHRCLKCNRRFARLDALNRHLKSETVHSSKHILNVSKQIVIKNTKISNSAKKIDGEALRQSVKQGVQSPQNVFDRKREQTIKNVEPLKFRRFSLDHGDANNAESCHILGATVSEVSGLTNNFFMNDKRIDQSELEKNPNLIKDIKCSVFRTKKYDVPINITDQSNKVGNAWDYHNNKGRPFPYSLSPPAGYFYNYNRNDKSLGALNYFKDTSMKRPGAELINTADKCQNRPVGIREHAEYGHRRDLHIDRRHSTTSLLNTERRVIQNVSTSNSRYTKFSGSKEVENLEFKLLLNNIFPKLQYITMHVDRLEKMVERLVRNSEKNIQ